LSTAQLVGITKDYSITSLLFLLLRKWFKLNVFLNKQGIDVIKLYKKGTKSKNY
jgi:hypothetical protein